MCHVVAPSLVYFAAFRPCTKSTCGTSSTLLLVGTYTSRDANLSGKLHSMFHTPYSNRFYLIFLLCKQSAETTSGWDPLFFDMKGHNRVMGQSVAAAATLEIAGAAAATTAAAAPLPPPPPPPPPAEKAAAPAAAGSRQAKRKASSLPEGDAPSRSLGDSSVPPASEASRVTLFAQFDSSVGTYCAEESGIRLHVRTGSLQDGQKAGPITIDASERLVVECGGSSFLVSAVVDCQPSGIMFDAPLYLDFRVGEEWRGDGAVQDLKGYKEDIRRTYEVSLFRARRFGQPGGQSGRCI